MRQLFVFSTALFVTLANCFTASVFASNPGTPPHNVEVKMPTEIQNTCRALLGGHHAQDASGAVLLPPQSDEQFLEHVMKAYPEMLKLTGQVNATPDGFKTNIGNESPSKKLFGVQHIEFDRTAVGLLTLKWVLENNYEAFTRPQAANVTMSPETFAHLRATTLLALQTPEDVDAMIAYMVINDLGKIKSVVADIEKEIGFTDVDHDKILLQALKSKPSISPSFSRLSTANKTKLIEGLEAQFNIGQFVQGENVPASLNGLEVLSAPSLQFYLIHAIFDIAGAAGHVNPSGSVVMTGPTYDGFAAASNALTDLRKGKTSAQVYDEYLKTSAQIRKLRLDVANPRERALIRIALLMRASGPQDTQIIIDSFNELPANAQAVLIKELNISGLDGQMAILPYYAPALLANAKAAFAGQRYPGAISDGIKFGLMNLARFYQLGRIEIRKRSGNGVYTLMLSQPAAAIKTPFEYLNKEVEIKPIAQDGEVNLIDKAPIDEQAFKRIISPRHISGKRFVTIGIGGGSDGVQAAQVASALRDEKEIAAVISVRTSKPSSQTANGHMAEARTIENHGGEVAPGVFRVLSNSTGSGRFLENLPAERLPTYLVIDEQNGTLEARLKAAIQDADSKSPWPTDTILAVDTGGDALFSSSVADGARATPDQDLRVLNTLAGLKGYNVLTAEVAAGVDSPANAQDVLKRAEAIYWDLETEQRRAIMAAYISWGMDGRNENRYGKTPLAWQMALSEQFGLQALSLPTSIVLDNKNPWNPFVVIQPSMQGIFIMDLHKHLNAIQPK